MLKINFVQSGINGPSCLLTSDDGRKYIVGLLVNSLSCHSLLFHISTRQTLPSASFTSRPRSDYFFSRDISQRASVALFRCIFRPKSSSGFLSSSSRWLGCGVFQPAYNFSFLTCSPTCSAFDSINSSRHKYCRPEGFQMRSVHYSCRCNVRFALSVFWSFWLFVQCFGRVFVVKWGLTVNAWALNSLLLHSFVCYLLLFHLSLYGVSNSNCLWRHILTSTASFHSQTHFSGSLCSASIAEDKVFLKKKYLLLKYGHVFCYPLDAWHSYITILFDI